MRNLTPFISNNLRLLLKVEASPKTFDATFGVYDSLLTRKERMAKAAYLYSKRWLGRACCVSFTTRACYNRFGVILGVDIGFHLLAFQRVNARTLSIACGVLKFHCAIN